MGKEAHDTRYNKQFFLSDFSADDVAKEVSEIITDEYEKVLIERSLKSRYGYLDKSEREEILKIAYDISMGDADTFPSYEERKNAVFKAVRDYVLEEKCVVPCGFADFRMREVYHWAEMVAEVSAEIYFDRREYEEFTSLLNMFLCEKEAKEEVIHLVMREGEVVLLNKRGRNVTEKYEKEFYSVAKGKNLSCEDLAISAVISAAPKKLVIHSFPNNSPLKETLLKIFSTRAKVCTGCSVCKKD